MLEGIKKIIDGISYTHREKAIRLTLLEEQELSHIFVLLLLGAFSGMPSPQIFVVSDLLPYLQRELAVLYMRAENSSDALSEMCGAFSVCS